MLTKALLSPINGPFPIEVTKAIFQSILYQQKALLFVNVLFIFNIFWLIPLTPYFKNSTTLTKFYFIIFFFFYIYICIFWVVFFFISVTSEDKTEFFRYTTGLCMLVFYWFLNSLSKKEHTRKKQKVFVNLVTIFV